MTSGTRRALHQLPAAPAEAALDGTPRRECDQETRRGVDPAPAHGHPPGRPQTTGYRDERPVQANQTRGLSRQALALTHDLQLLAPAKAAQREHMTNTWFNPPPNRTFSQSGNREPAAQRPEFSQNDVHISCRLGRPRWSGVEYRARSWGSPHSERQRGTTEVQTVLP